MSGQKRFPSCLFFGILCGITLHLVAVTENAHAQSENTTTPPPPAQPKTASPPSIIYTWTDGEDRKHFTNDLGQVPPDQRAQAKADAEKKQPTPKSFNVHPPLTEEEERKKMYEKRLKEIEKKQKEEEKIRQEAEENRRERDQWVKEALKQREEERELERARRRAR